MPPPTKRFNLPALLLAPPGSLIVLLTHISLIPHRCCSIRHARLPPSPGGPSPSPAYSAFPACFPAYPVPDAASPAISKELDPWEGGDIPFLCAVWSEAGYI